jgi:hypothetical protein
MSLVAELSGITSVEDVIARLAQKLGIVEAEDLILSDSKLVSSLNQEGFLSDMIEDLEDAFPQSRSFERGWSPCMPIDMLH